MTRRIRIHVGFREIWEGKPKWAKICPVALACKKALPGRDITVTDDVIHIDWTYAPHGEHIPLPENARKFIKRFDNKKWVLPITFYVEVPM